MRFPNFQCSANLNSHQQECRTHNITWQHTAKQKWGEMQDSVTAADVLHGNLSMDVASWGGLIVGISKP